MAERHPDRRDIMPGTLDMLVLKVLASAPMHGYGIAQQLQRLSKEALQVEEGSLYPALQRMRQKGWITAEWGQTTNNQRAPLLHPHVGGASPSGRRGSPLRRPHRRDSRRPAQCVT